MVVKTDLRHPTSLTNLLMKEFSVLFKFRLILYDSQHVRDVNDGSSAVLVRPLNPNPVDPPLL